MTKIKRVGDQNFRAFLTAEMAVLTPESARDVLAFICQLIGLSSDLSGDLVEIQHLLDGFSLDLSPHDRLWRDIAELVQMAFPSKSLSDKTDLARAVHQLRYVISSQQAEYVRRRYKTGQMTDAQALAIYLKKQPYTLRESARLHNKVQLDQGKPVFPDGLPTHNIKILLQFHTEFILNSQGRFLNELDAEAVTEAGIVNGASFNYAKRNDQRHHELDIAPVRVHDPAFRKLVMKGYQAPSLTAYRSKPTWYALSRKNLATQVKKENKKFKQLVKRGR